MKFLPQRAAIDAFGNGGFRFAGMSHQGSLLILPSGMRAWPPREIASASVDDMLEVLAEKAAIDFFLIGTGEVMQRPPIPVMDVLAAENIQTDFMSTAAAINIYNVILAEGRRVAAALVAVANAYV
jgi:uncharacterized protein